MARSPMKLPPVAHERTEPGAAREEQPDEPGLRSRRSATTPVVALLTFLAVLAGLLWRNATLFTVRVYEVGDAAANSLLVNDAKALSLLAGHYSRLGFNHPGPAVLYLQATGEAFFTDLLGLTPGPFNGQVLAVFILQAAVLAAVVGIVFSWTRRWPVAAAGLAVCLVWYEAHTYALSSTWMPHVVVAPFLLLLVSAASVAAGNVRHLWLLAASAGLLVHAHVEFVLFAPILTVCALVAWAVTERLSPRAMWAAGPRSWLVALAVVGAFVAPIALNTLLHWPGEIPKYLSYSSDQAAARPPLRDALHYARRFWAPDSSYARFLPLVLVLIAAAAARWAPRGVRRPLVSLAGAAVLAEALFVVYALVGIDDLTQDYVGLFTWSIPLALILLVVVSLAMRLPNRAVPAGALTLGAVASLALVATGDGTALRSEGIASLPQVSQAVQSAAQGRVVLLDVGEGTGPFYDGTGLLLNLERSGQVVCITSPRLRSQVTPQRLCTAEERAEGVVFELTETGSRPGSSFPGVASDITVRTP